jgi:hypothetical protein
MLSIVKEELGAQSGHSNVLEILLENLLINRVGKIADIDYTTMEESTKTHMPAGLESQEVYLFSYL